MPLDPLQALPVTGWPAIEDAGPIGWAPPATGSAKSDPPAHDAAPALPPAWSPPATLALVRQVEKLVVQSSGPAPGRAPLPTGVRTYVPFPRY
jgi:hypothetical protein